VMQRVYEGRTKQELVAEQMARHRFQHAVRPRTPPPSRGEVVNGPAAIRRGPPTPAEIEP